MSSKPNVNCRQANYVVTSAIMCLARQCQHQSVIELTWCKQLAAYAHSTLDFLSINQQIDWERNDLRTLCREGVKP